MTDIQLESSDLRLTLSPDVLELGGRLAASVLEPLMQVGGIFCAILRISFGLPSLQPMHGHLCWSP